MSGWLEALAGAWTAVGAHLWQASWFLLLPALLLPALRRAPARAANAILWTGMAKLLLPLALLAPLIRAGVDLLPSGWLVHGAPVAGSFVEQVVVWLGAPGWAAVPSAAPTAAAWWPLALSAVWLAGAAWLSWSWRRRRPRRPDRGVPPERAPVDLRARLAEAIGGSGIPRGALRVTDSGMVPCVHGLLRPRILLSAALIRGLEIDELRAVLLHEDAHRRRRDPLLAILQRAALTLFFFYPPLWWLVRRLRETAEQACDEAALARGVDPACYARALARVVRLELDPVAAPAVLGLGAPSRLARRLERIRDSRRYAMRLRHRLSVSAALVALVLASLLPAVVSAEDAEADSGLPGVDAVVEGSEALDGIAGIDRPFALEGERVAVDALLDAFRAATGFAVRFEGDLDDPLVLRTEPGSGTLRTALLRLAAQNRLTYRVDGSTLTVLPQPRLAGTDGVTAPEIVADSKVDPVYPPEALAARRGGLVVLQALVRADGTVGETRILREEPQGLGFGQSARVAVARWRYRPAEYGGRPVDVYFTVVVNYALSDKDKEDAETEGPILASAR